MGNSSSIMGMNDVLIDDIMLLGEVKRPLKSMYRPSATRCNALVALGPYI